MRRWSIRRRRCRSTTTPRRSRSTGNSWRHSSSSNTRTSSIEAHRLPDIEQEKTSETEPAKGAASVAEAPAPITPAQQSIIPPTPRPPAILTRQLTRRYGSLTALDHLDLQLEAGDVFGFIGPNGAGKTTTMKILAGLLEPSFGVAQILGKTVSENGDFVRRNVGYMPDTFGVYEDLRVDEYLE